MSKPDPRDFVLRGKKNETIIRPPGSLMGYDFVIEDCHNCSIYLLDFTAQVQIDDCVDCTIILGPVDGSAFFRDCSNLKVCAVVRQLRTRECHACHFNLHCHTDPIVELSSDVAFSEWDVAYNGLKQQFASANLDPAVNNWQKVYDFNKDEDVKGTTTHWTLSDTPFWNPPGTWSLAPDGMEQPTPEDRCAVPGTSVAQDVSGGGFAFGDDAATHATQPPPAEAVPDMFSVAPTESAAPLPPASAMFGEPPAGPGDGFSSTMATQSLAESNATAEWRAANARKAAEREATERVDQEALREAARKVLEGKQEERARKVEIAKKNNREAESISSAEQSGTFTDGNVWGAVLKMLGSSDTTEKRHADLSKMRSLIVKLKHAKDSPSVAV
ncbi:Xrp2 protein [Pycnococcus provasolii]|uniref:Clathrin light chain n=1 Tax=Pycnococcus provasolii TaxID=41880 RepID=A0A830HIW6_9CHLO|nr:Xrp2 protein [Pycnococcus provasolii]|eukprot:CAMPEP_0119193586 /NCGR_PEP_ID=MMETSP1316-20130426/3682_1 /TAXON_ID=41880 /ORGANISM="Pycnococcus provasolii, Strain RCC2336" /LENGTH=385 /DNA_ID=CAMNT_0007188857 /DNA_START=118 /DNA_END=1275 /DNA_ORIENTATION=+